MPAEVQIVLKADASQATAAFGQVKQSAEATFGSLGDAGSNGTGRASAGVEALTKKMADWYKSGDTATFLKDHLVDLGDKGGSAMTTLHAAAGPVDEILGHLGVTGGSLGGVLSALVSPAAMIGGALVALAGAGIAAVERMGDLAVRNRDLTAITGGTVEQTHNLINAFRLADVGTDGLERGIGKIAAEMDSGGKAFEKYGISIRNEATGNMKTPMQVWDEWRDKMSESTDVAQRDAEAKAVLGKAYTAFLPILSMTKEEYRALLATAAEKSPWDEDKQKQAMAYNHIMAELGVAWEGLVVKFAQPIVATISLVSNWSGSDWLETMKSGLSGVWSGLMDGAEGAKQKQDEASSAAADAWKRWADSVQASGTSAYTDLADKGKTAEVSITQAIENALAAKEQLTQREIQLREGVYASGLQAVQRFVAQEDILINIGVAQHTLSEREALDKRLALLETEKAALTDYWNKRVADANNAKDRDAGVWQQMVAARAQALGQIDNREQQSVLARIQLEQKYTDDVAKNYGDAAGRQIKEEEAFDDAIKKLRGQTEEETAKLYGTSEQAFLTSQGNKRAAEVAALAASISDQTNFETAVEALDAKLGVERAAFYRQQEQAEIASITRATQEGQKIGQGKITAIDQAHRDSFSKLDALRANDLISEEDFQERLERLNADTLQKKLEAVGASDQAWVTKTDETLRDIDALLDQYKDDSDIREGLITRKYQVESDARIRMFETEEGKRKEQEIKETTALAAEITRQNTEMQRLQTANDAVRAAMTQRDGDYFGFIGAQLDLAVGRWGSTWDQIKDATSTVVDSVQSTVGKGLFDFIKTGTFDAKKFFGEMTDAFLHAATDLISKEAIKGLVGLGKDFVEGFKGADGGIGSALTSIGTKIAGFFGKGQPGEELQNFGTEVVDDFKGLAAGVGGALTDTETKLSSFFGATGHADDLLDFGSDIVDGLDDIGPGMASALTGPGGATSIIDTFTKNPIVKGVLDFGGSILDSLKGAWSGLTQWFTDFSAGLGSFADVPFVKKIIGFGASIYDSLVKVGPSISDWFMKTVVPFINDFLDSQAVHKLLQWGSDFLSGVVQFLGFGFAKGGVVPSYYGPGHGFLGAGPTDTVPALLTPGELVLTKEQTSTFLQLIDKIAGTDLANTYGSVGGLISSILDNVLGGDASLNWSLGGLRALLFGTQTSTGLNTVGILGAGGMGEGVLGTAVQGFFEAWPAIGAMMSGLFSNGQGDQAVIQAMIGSLMATATPSIAAALAGAGTLALGPLALAAAPVIAGMTSALSMLFTSTHYQDVRKQAAGDWATWFPLHLFDIERQDTRAGILDALGRMSSFHPTWLIKPPPDWQTNANADPTFISVGYLAQDFTHLGAGRTLTEFLHRQWELVTKAERGNAADIEALQNRVRGGALGLRSYTIMNAERSYQASPMDTLQRLVGTNIDPKTLPIDWTSVDWQSIGFTDFNNALSSVLAQFPPDWTIYHQGGVVPALLEPGELIVPKTYTQEVLDRAAAASPAAGGGGVNVTVNVNVTGGGALDLRFWRENGPKIRRVLQDEMRLLRT